MRADSPDTAADATIRTILSGEPLTGFVVTAGAGSGKTTSLVKALAYVIETRGPRLQAGTQQVACITYTEVAAKEIHADVGNDPRVHVSTIHSFLWALAKPFQNNIAAWVRDRVTRKIDEVTARQAGYTARTSAMSVAKDNASLERLRDQLTKLDDVSHYRYGTGSDYAAGVLGHNDILNMVPQMIVDRPLLAKITARRFPVIFVDESQDTFRVVVDCLKHVWTSAQGKVCLGFFGDPMQQIYPQGIGAISLEAGWSSVEKPENFRSSTRVLSVVNAVRADADGLRQLSGRPASEQVEGEAYFFVLPADDNRTLNLERVRSWLDRHSSAGSWTDNSPDVGAKILMILHRMVARRLGFDGLYSAFNDNSSSLGDAFGEGSAWPLQPFEKIIMPICDADGANSGAVMSILRGHSPVLANVPASRFRAALSSAKSAVVELRRIGAAGGAGSVGAAIHLAVNSGLVAPDARWAAYLNGIRDEPGSVLSTSTVAVLDMFMECDLTELAGYFRYIRQESPYSTQHGTKGSEFRKVIVVLDDDEGKAFRLYSYDKLLGIRSLSSTDQKNISGGTESVLERTRRLLYVSVSRAVESLAVVLFVDDVDTAVSVVGAGSMAAGQQVLTVEDLAESLTS